MKIRLKEKITEQGTFYTPEFSDHKSLLFKDVWETFFFYNCSNEFLCKPLKSLCLYKDTVRYCSGGEWSADSNQIVKYKYKNSKLTGEAIYTDKIRQKYKLDYGTAVFKSKESAEDFIREIISIIKKTDEENLNNSSNVSEQYSEPIEINFKFK